MESWLAIGNASAGSSQADTVAAALAAMRSAAQVAHVATEGPEQLRTALADHHDVDLVVVMGGDGSLHAVVQALRESGRLPDSVVGLVPFGTGNDFARTLGLPDDPVDAARALIDAPARSIDVIEDAEGQVVVNAAHIGLGARAAARAKPLKPVLGPAAYAAGAVSTLFSSTPWLQVRVDGVRRTGRIAQVAVGNGRYVGGGGELLPQARVDDGLMDVAIVRAVTVGQRLRYAWALRRGDHPRASGVEYMTARSVSVDGEALTCTSDGELSEPRTRHGWRIVPGGLRMRLPQPAQPTSAS